MIISNLTQEIEYFISELIYIGLRINALHDLLIERQQACILTGIHSTIKWIHLLRTIGHSQIQDMRNSCSWLSSAQFTAHINPLSTKKISSEKIFEEHFYLFFTEFFFVFCKSFIFLSKKKEIFLIYQYLKTTHFYSIRVKKLEILSISLFHY